MTTVLEVSNVSKTFNRRKALDGVSLSVRAGELVGLFGRNGAGKTTLLRTIMGLLDPDAGEIRLHSEVQWVGKDSSPAKSERADLSGGEVRRIELSEVRISRPGLLLLDEPFSGVDPIQVEELKFLIRELPREGMGVFLADHNAAEMLKICDRAYILHEGRIVANGTPGELSKG